MRLISHKNKWILNRVELRSNNSPHWVSGWEIILNVRVSKIRPLLCRTSTLTVIYSSFFHFFFRIIYRDQSPKSTLKSSQKHHSTSMTAVTGFQLYEFTKTYFHHTAFSVAFGNQTDHLRRFYIRTECGFSENRII